MIGWFTFCGFAKQADHLVFEVHVECHMDAVRLALKPGEIADDPNVIHCYELSKAAVSALTGLMGIPDADYFVNATQPPQTYHAR